MLRFLILILVSASLFRAVQAAETLRTFTDTQGRKLEAKYVKMAGENSIVVAKRNGQTHTLALAKLSPADQTYVEQVTLKSRQAVAKINAAIGHPLFSLNSLWESDPQVVAKRLGWPSESKTDQQVSFRLYPDRAYRFLGTRAYSAALQGSPTNVDVISIVFANKGDLFGADGSAQDHFKRGEPIPKNHVEIVKQAMKNDVEKISTALTQALGPATTQRYGEGSTRRNVQRWDWQDHALLLTAQDDQYVGLQVQPLSFADSGGKASRTSDVQVRARIRKNIIRRENGDVVVSNFPMVDQGPKGYCVPATFERCLRYLDVPADMYLLAIAGETSVDGTTYIEPLLNAIGRDVKRKGRRVEILPPKDFKMKKLSRFIDNGLPIIWCLYSTESFNTTADARTAERKEITDWTSWGNRMKTVASNASKGTKPSTHEHVAIIIGYNAATGELAFTDSWGPNFKERWITLEEAAKHSQEGHFVITL